MLNVILVSNVIFQFYLILHVNYSNVNLPILLTISLNFPYLYTYTYLTQCQTTNFTNYSLQFPLPTYLYIPNSMSNYQFY